MIIGIGITLSIFIIVQIYCCIAVTTSYDDSKDNEMQEKYLKEMR